MSVYEIMISYLPIKSLVIELREVCRATVDTRLAILVLTNVEMEGFGKIWVDECRSLMLLCFSTVGLNRFSNSLLSWRRNWGGFWI